MKYHLSLRYRIIIAFFVFGLVLAFSYSWLIYATLFFAEDTIYEKQLESEINSWLKEYRNNPDAELPSSAYIKSYVGLAEMPEPFRSMAGGLTEGFYETDGPGAVEGPEGYHIFVKEIADRDEYLYLFYDTGALKIDQQYDRKIDITLILISLIISVIGAGIGFLISRRVIAPVTELADHVARSDPSCLPVDLSRRFADDEIGALARTVEQSMQRIQTFIEREKEFTRDASHELRTPVTVIKGAIEIIQQSPEYREGSLKRPIDRIDRSARIMSQTIETFLWLAREQSEQDADQSCDVVLAARESFNEHCDLFKDKMIETVFYEKGAPVISAPAAVFRIVVNNLLHNAFTHTAKGKVTVNVNDQCIEIYNSGVLSIPSDIDFIADPRVRGKESCGFGFGFAIMKRLCDRFGWRLDVISSPGHGTTVTLQFSEM